MRLIVTTLTAFALVTPTQTHAWTEKTVEIVVPFSAGGVADVFGRKLAEHLEKKRDMTVRVVNKPGASGLVAFKYVQTAPPDGSVVFLATSATMTTAKHLMGESFTADPLNDLLPVAHLASYPSVFLAAPRAGFTTLDEYVVAVKKGGAQTYAAPGSGTFAYLMAHLFHQKAGLLDAQPVQTKGFAGVMNLLLGGHVSAGIGSVQDAVTHAKSGVRALAVSGARRVAALPDVPTFRQLGYDFDGESWFGAYVPKRTSAELSDKIGSAFRAALNARDIYSWVLTFGTPTGFSSAELAGIQRAEYTRWGKVVETLPKK